MATSKKGGEAVAASMAATFTTAINAEIDAIKAVWGDSVPLPHVAASNIYVMLRKVIPNEGVAIVITPFSGKQVVNHATDWGQIAYRMEVDVVCQSDDEYTVQAQLDRYLTAVWQVVMKHQQLDGSIDTVVGCDPVQFGRSGVYHAPNKPGLLEAYGAWEIDVYVEQLTT